MKLQRIRTNPWVAAALLVAAVLFLGFAGAASAADPRSIPMPPMAGVAGDFNQDGKTDILWQNAYTGALKVLLMNDVAPLGFVPVNLGGPNEDFLTVVATRDFDGDAKTDILFYRPTDGLLGIWYMDGVNVVAKALFEELQPEYVPVSVYDYNSDGSPDILFERRKGATDIMVWLLQGTKRIGKARVFLQSPEMAFDWRVAGAGDFDKDGDFDLALFYDNPTLESRGAWSTLVSIAMMDGDVGTLGTVTQVGDRNWMMRAVGDFSADGFPDLLWENAYDGSTGLWMMEGRRVQRTALVTGGAYSERGWHIVGPR